MSPITPFTIHVPDAEISLLKQKLSLTRFPDEPSDAGWSQGAPLSRIRELAHTWETSFDWRTAEAALNKLPQFTTKISASPEFGELDIHFVHARSKVEGAIPLLFVHGWPGGFWEVQKILPMLVEGREGEVAFHVVAPSLPGFGWSEAPKCKGFGIEMYARTCHELMVKLGYEEYVTQGGDWGSMITRAQGHLFPQSVKASHLNFFPCIPSLSSLLYHPVAAATAIYHAFTSGTWHRLARAKQFQSKGSGYYAIQSTRPQTLAYSLSDSPIGLLAWIFEKLHDWTDAYPWTSDEILTWVSLYYFSRSGPGASVRIYYENEEASGINGQFTFRNWIEGPKLGLSHFPKELAPMPYKWAGLLGEVVLEKEHETGGHFAAFEVPEVLVADVKEMFGRRGPCEGVVKGCSGYKGR